MTEWIVDDRGGVCHQCDTDFQRLAGHWARNQSCTYRDLDDTHHETIRGLLPGDGNLDNPNDGPPALRISSMRRPHIEWCHDQLGWSPGELPSSFTARTCRRPATVISYFP
ncbi:hypothetical protein ACFQER_16150 [Halomicroarcula sp. GCM10025894]|uniref:hypothetical protein n=1 Tax=Halomicroarcula sp. GCM10025894 TaxID=3252673 RepID=UPI00362329F8